MLFSLFAFFDPYLEGIKHWSEHNVKCCRENFFVCTHLDRFV